MVLTGDTVFAVFHGPVTPEEMEIRRKLGLFINPNKDIANNLDFDWFQGNVAMGDLTKRTKRGGQTSKHLSLRSANSNLNSSSQHDLFSSKSSVYDPSDSTLSCMTTQDLLDMCEPNRTAQKTSTIKKKSQSLCQQELLSSTINKTANSAKKYTNIKANKRTGLKSISIEPKRKSLRSIHSSLLVLDKKQVSRRRKTLGMVQNTHGNSDVILDSSLSQWSNSASHLKNGHSLQFGEDSGLTNDHTNVNGSFTIPEISTYSNPEETKGKDSHFDSSLFTSYVKVDRNVQLELMSRTESKNNHDLFQKKDASLSVGNVCAKYSLEKSVGDQKSKISRKRSHSSKSLNQLSPNVKRVKTVVQPNKALSFCDVSQDKQPLKALRSSGSQKKTSVKKNIPIKKLSTSSSVISNKKLSRANKTLSSSLLCAHQIKTEDKPLLKISKSSTTLRKTNVKNNDTSLKKIASKKLNFNFLSSHENELSKVSCANETTSDPLLQGSQIKTRLRHSIKSLKSLPLKKQTIKKNVLVKKISPKKLSSSVVLTNKNHAYKITRANKTMCDSLVGSQVKTDEQPIKRLTSVPLLRTSVRKTDLTLKKASTKKLNSSLLTSNKDLTSKAFHVNKTLSISLHEKIKRGTQSTRSTISSLASRKISVNKNVSKLKKISPKKLSSSFSNFNKDLASKNFRANKTVSKRDMQSIKSSRTPLQKTSVKKDSLKKISPKKLSSSLLSSNKTTATKTCQANKSMSNSLLCGSKIKRGIESIKGSRSSLPMRKTSVRKGSLKKISPKKLRSSLLFSNKTMDAKTCQANKSMSNSLRDSKIERRIESIKSSRSSLAMRKTSVKNDSLKKISPKKASLANKTLSGSLHGSQVKRTIRTIKGSRHSLPLKKTNVKKDSLKTVYRANKTFDSSLLRKPSIKTQDISGSLHKSIRVSQRKSTVNKHSSFESITSSDLVSDCKDSHPMPINKNPNDSSMFSPHDTFHSFRNETTNGHTSAFEKRNTSSADATDFSLCCGDSCFDGSFLTTNTNRFSKRSSDKTENLDHYSKNKTHIAKNYLEKRGRKSAGNRSLNGALLESNDTKFKRNVRQNKTLNESLLKQLMLDRRRSPEEKNSESSLLDESLVMNKTKDLFLRSFNLSLKSQVGNKCMSQNSPSTSRSYTFTPDKDNTNQENKNSDKTASSLKENRSGQCHLLSPDKNNLRKSVNYRSRIGNKSFANEDQQTPESSKNSSINAKRTSQILSKSLNHWSSNRYSFRSNDSCSKYDNSSVTTLNNLSGSTNVLNKPKLLVSGEANSDLSWSKKLNTSKVLKAHRPNYVYSPSSLLYKK